MDDSESRFLGDYDEPEIRKQSWVQCLVFCVLGLLGPLFFPQITYSQTEALSGSPPVVSEPRLVGSFRPQILHPSVRGILTQQALAAGFSSTEAEALATSAQYRASVAKNLTPQEVMNQYIQTGRRVTNLAERRSLKFQDLWTFPKSSWMQGPERIKVMKMAGRVAARPDAPRNKNGTLNQSVIEEVAIDARVLQRRGPGGMSSQEAISRALHFQKEMNFFKSGGATLGQIAFFGLVADSIVNPYQKPGDLIIENWMNHEVPVAVAFTGAEQTTTMLTGRRLVESGVPKLFLKTTQVMVPLSVAFIVADGLWNRRGEIGEVLHRHSLSVNPKDTASFGVDLLRAIMHDQAYDLGVGIAMFGSLLVPATAFEESAAVASALTARGVFSSLGLAMRAHPIASSLAISLAYLGWTAGRPLYEKHLFEEHQKQASNYWSESQGEKPTQDNLWLRGQRWFTQKVDNWIGFTVKGRVVSQNPRLHALTNSIDQRDSAYAYLIGQMKQVGIEFKDYIDRSKQRVSESTIGSKCYRGLQIAINSGDRQGINTFIRREVAPPVLETGNFDLDGISYSELVEAARAKNQSVHDYLQDRYASSEVTINEEDSDEQVRDKQCLRHLQQSQLNDPRLQKGFEAKLIGYELDADYKWADFASDPKGVSTWAEKIKEVTHNSIQELNSLMAEEERLLNERSRQPLDGAEKDLISKRLARIHEFQQGIAQHASVI